MRGMFPTDAACAKGLRFSRGDVTHASFAAWIESERPERLFALSPSRMKQSNPNLLLVARSSEGKLDIHQPTTSFSPRTDLRNLDVVAFVESRGEERALIEARWLSWNREEKWTDANDWPTFARAAMERAGSDLVDGSPRVLAAAALPDEARQAWSAIANAHRNPDFSAIYDIRFVESRADLPLFSDRQAARAALASALDAITAFASAEKLDGWAKYFGAARRAMDESIDDALVQRYFGDSGLDGEALRLLDAAWKADAFGGMGSWNDVRPVGDYASVSDALFKALPIAVEAALNTAHGTQSS